MKQIEDKYITFKAKTYLGSLPEGGATDWWTQDDWDKHSAYVEKLKISGEYMKEVEYTVSMLSDAYKDEPKFFSGKTNIESYSLEIFDFGQIKIEEIDNGTG